MRFVKGHGTENDFVLLPEPPEQLSVELVQALCDRRAGLGGDGVLAVRREGRAYFMDYRNADGSIAEICGNGIRVFARYLVGAGLEEPGTFEVQTRAGACRVAVPTDGGDITVEMGSPKRLPDAKVSVSGTAWPGYGWGIGNPHVVALDAGPLDSLDLSTAPVIDPASAFPDGANVEFVERLGDSHIRMRVFERGVGETRSCGSGACVAAVAAMDVRGNRTTYDVDVPGGRLRVNWREDHVVTLAGPAILIASGEIDTRLLSG